MVVIHEKSRKSWYKVIYWVCHYFSHVNAKLIPTYSPINAGLANSMKNTAKYVISSVILIFRDEMVLQLCKMCNRHFPGTACLKMHQKTHHKSRHPVYDEDMFKCSYCSGVFHEKGALQEHLRFFHLEEECLITGVVCRGAFEMYQYISECHPPFFLQGKLTITISAIISVRVYISLSNAVA